MTKLNLFDGSPLDVRIFVQEVCDLAIKDFKAGFRKDWKTNNLRSGEEIFDQLGFEINSRMFHKKMATSIYANTIWTLRGMQEEKDKHTDAHYG